MFESGGNCLALVGKGREEKRREMAHKEEYNKIVFELRVSYAYSFR